MSPADDYAGREGYLVETHLNDLSSACVVTRRGGASCRGIAMATSVAERIADSDDEASTTRVDDLIQRGEARVTCLLRS